jgi:YidC/Oxa1 family membrane protein insertase
MIDRISQNVRLVIASVIAALVIFLWQALYVDPMLEASREEQQKIEARVRTKPIIQNMESNKEPLEAIEESARIKFSNNSISGSINLTGARLDDLVLKKYKKTQAPDSKDVVLLSPAKTKESYFIEFGWLAQDNSHLQLPDAHTRWHADKNDISPGETATLRYINPQGIEFIIQVAIDENYIFKFKQKVLNKSSHNIELSNYGLINRANGGAIEDNLIIHEGAIGVFDGKLNEISYSDITSSKKMEFDKFDWIGFSDKYWLSALIPTTHEGLSSKFSIVNKHGHKRFQASFISTNTFEISAGNKMEWPEVLVFAGAKELEVLDEYETLYNIKLFDRAVDFGFLYFITKPIFELLHYFYGLVGNFGVAILILTVLIKLLLFPLAHKGFKGMNRLKYLQPKIAALKEKYGDDATTFHKAMLELYRKEKVNPMSGCLPILLQIPIFFALYKVLYVTIEMRQAPFFGWIKDLSAPDHLTITNLFGLIPWDPPSFLMIGVFPMLMALTMFIQQRLNPEPTDPVQAKVMRFLPIIFLFMFSSFPAGLVIYWTWSNTLSIVQQLIIKKLESPTRRDK